MKNLILVITLGFLLQSCSDATRGKFFSIGDSRSIECYSGGKLIYKGRSTGKIRTEASSDGYYFVDSKTDDLVEVSGDCILRSN